MIISMVKQEGVLRPLEVDRPMFDQYRMKVSDGEVVQVKFMKYLPPARARARKYFHLMRDAYAAVNGYTKEYAKDELCIGWGISVTLEDARENPPDWSGHLVKLWDREYVRKSVMEYTREEMSALIEGTILACIEADVDIHLLVDDYRKEARRD